MAITGKQVRQLRGMANNLKPTVIVGKEGVTANILKQVNEGLEAHELIKVSVLCETGSQAARSPIRRRPSWCRSSASVWCSTARPPATTSRRSSWSSKQASKRVSVIAQLKAA